MTDVHSSSLQDKSSSHDEKYEGVEHHEHSDGLPHVTHVANAKMVTEAHNAVYAAALLEGHLNPWSKQSFQLYACAMVSFLCSCGNGYDGSLMTGINGMKPYKDTFNSGNSAKSTGITFSIYTIGQMAGALFADKIIDRWGRRAGMFVGCLIILCGTAIIASSNANGQFLAGRFILGTGIAVAIVAAPTYCIEISPPQWRGRMTALYNTGWNGGAIPAAAIVWGTSTIASNWSWRIPLIIQAVPASLVICMVWFCPESPRWLYANGREKEARDFLIRYHGNNNPNNTIVLLEMEEFKANISRTGSDKRWWDYSALIKTRSARWRSLMVFLMGLFGQMSGNGLGYFNLQIYESLGFGPRMQFAMNLIGTCSSAVTAWVAVSLSDKIPRRRVLVYGTFACSFLLAANAGLSAKWASYGTGPKDLNVGKLGAAFFFLFGIVYSFTYTPLREAAISVVAYFLTQKLIIEALYPAECLETTARAKGMSMKILVINVTSFINLYCIPIGLANIQWRFMLVYVFWDFIEGILWHLLAVETVGRTLEELEEVFNSKYPPGASKKKRKIAVKDTGDIVVVDS